MKTSTGIEQNKFTRSGIHAVFTVAGMEAHKARAATAMIIDELAAALIAGKVIELRGFGTFELRGRKSRKRFNPRTMAPIDVPAWRVIFFRPSGKLRRAINGK